MFSVRNINQHVIIIVENCSYLILFTFSLFISKLEGEKWGLTNHFKIYRVPFFISWILDLNIKHRTEQRLEPLLSPQKIKENKWILFHALDHVHKTLTYKSTKDPRAIPIWNILLESKHMLCFMLMPFPHHKYAFVHQSERESKRVNVKENPVEGNS